MKSRNLRGLALTQHWLIVAKQMQEKGRQEVTRGSFRPFGIPIRTAEYRLDRMYKIPSQLGPFPTGDGYRISYKLQDLVTALENELQLASGSNLP